MRRLLPLFALLALSVVEGLFTATPAAAATFQVAESFTLAAPMTDDTYVAGGNVSITKDVSGDLFAAGSTVNIENRITQGLNAAGGTVHIFSNVGDDVRVAGGNVTVRGMIRGDLIVFGGTVVVGSDAVVMGDMVVHGGDVTVRGTVGKKLLVRGGNVALEGIFHGDVDVQSSHLVMSGPVEGDARLMGETITIQQGASFKGNVGYWSLQAVQFGTTLAAGQRAEFHPEYRHTMPQRAPAAGLVGAIFSLSLLAGILVILVLLAITRTFFADAGKELVRRPWRSFITGLLYFILTPLAVLFLFITIIGFPLAILLLAAYLLTFLFLAPLTALVAARWIEHTWQQKWAFLPLLGVTTGIFIVFRLLMFLPVIGWAVKAVVTLFVVGALLRTKYVKWKKVR